MKNVRVRVIESCPGNLFWYAICDGKRRLMDNMFRRNGSYVWVRKSAAIKAAKAMAKRIGIKYDPEIIKMHGC